MSIITNPVLVSVVVLCLLCLCKLNVLMALILSALTGAVLAGISIPDAMGILCDGFGANAGTALAYIFLGTFASAVAATGLADMMSKKLSRLMGKSGTVLLLVLAGVACLSQNLVPVHIAFIPIMIPPMLALFNQLQVDRRAAACSLAFGLKAPYICVPFGFGAIFMGIIADNMTANGMEVTISDVARYN
ncbi:MAG: sodium:proton antiporter, partial [Oscillibacter sp.]|nr:sodium:proton antiporter [Oscillibacter sp.]